MFGRMLFGVVTLGAAATACAPPGVGLIPPQLLRVDRSYRCNANSGEADPDRCVFWRTGDGEVFFGPFSMVALPPHGADVIIPAPVIELHESGR